MDSPRQARRRAQYAAQHNAKTALINTLERRARAAARRLKRIDALRDLLKPGAIGNDLFHFDTVRGVVCDAEDDAILTFAEEVTRIVTGLVE